MVDPGQVLQLGVNGLILGSILTLGGIGLSLVYGVLKLANFAHGDLLTVGTYLALLTFTMTTLGLVGSLLVALLATAGLALVLLPFLARRWHGVALGAAVAFAVPLSFLFRGGADLLAWRLAPQPLVPSVAFGVLVPLVPILGLALRRKAKTGQPLSTSFPLGVGSAAAACALVGVAAPLPVPVLAVVGAAAATALAALVLVAQHRPRFPAETFWLHATGILAASVAVALFGWGLNLGLLVALLFAATVTSGLAVGLDIVLWRPLRRRRATLVTMLIVSIGLALVLRNVLVMAWGGDIERYPLPAARAHDVLGGVRVTDAQVVVLLLGLFLALATHLLLRYTRLGKAMRALADNAELARVTGINVDRVLMVTWALAAGLVALAGVLLGLGRSFTPNLGFFLLLLMFASVILGGLGSPYGAMLGGMVIGLTTELAPLFVPIHYKNAVAFALMIGVLLVRPRGLMGGAP